MYKITEEKYGYKLIFGDTITAQEMQQWVDDSYKTLFCATSHFAIFVDMRTLQPLDKAAQACMKEGQKLYKESGMTRSAVVVSNKEQCQQFKEIAWKTGIYKWERYFIDSTENWEERAIAWLENGIDTDPIETDDFIDSLLQNTEELE